MAQRSSRKRRKRRRAVTAAPARAPREDSAPAAESGPTDPVERGYARGRAKDEAARAALVPLAEGERPRAVTVAGALAAVLGGANVLGYVFGVEVQGQQPQLVGVLLYSGLMFVAAWGCLRVRYWAVLGMQALLGLAVVIFSLLLVKAESALAAAIALAVIGAAGTLFWFLVKAMARIQLPERPRAR